MLQINAASTVASVNLYFVWMIELYEVLAKCDNAISQLLAFKFVC